MGFSARPNDNYKEWPPLYQQHGGGCAASGARRAVIANLLAVAGGGALGAVARYLVYIGTTGVLGFEAPVATLVVNVVGSFLMGLWIEAAALTLAVSQQAQLFFVVGVLGGFTTFSAFALDFAVLYERGRFALCLAYVGASVVLSLVALFAGLYVAREYLQAG